MEGFGHLFPDAHGAVTLHVAVSSDGTGAGAGLAHIAAKQQKVRDFLNVGYAVLMLRDAHGPADDGLLRVDSDIGGGLGLVAGKDTGSEDFAPGNSVESAEKVFIAVGVGGD